MRTPKIQTSRFLYLLVVGLFLSSCSHIAFLNRNRESGPLPVKKDDQPFVDKPTEAAPQNNQLAAAPELKEIVCGEPALSGQNPEQYFAKTYQRARCLEESKKFAEAIEIYRQLATSPIGNNQQALNLKAMSFYRLSYCFEALDQNEKMLTSLMDAQKRETNLPDITRRIEVPARIGIARARMQNVHLAQQQFSIARSNVKFFVRGVDNAGRVQVARVLLQMAQTTFQFMPSDKITNYAPALQMAQELALQSQELDTSLETEVYQTLREFYGNVADILKLHNDRELHAHALNLIDVGDELVPKESKGDDFFNNLRVQFENQTYSVQEGLDVTPESRERQDRKVPTIQKLERVKTK